MLCDSRGRGDGDGEVGGYLYSGGFKWGVVFTEW